ncbi:MAG: thioesterase family protein [candidate division Zixibacteria bacterium]|nr:thioesterase family protein [candidate division Zixibacteria bacterium]
MASFTDYYTVKLHDSDAAGVVFFANVFRIVHDVYEQLLKELGYNFTERFAAGDFVIPVAHAEADYLRPLRVGDMVEINATVVEIGDSSFVMKFQITDSENRLFATVKTVHVAVDGRTFRRMNLPENFKKRLAEAAGTV